jgi:hypothetical protein
MTTEIPGYGLRAYSLFYIKYGSKERFKQSELDWIVGKSMKKKIFSLLLKNGWIKKESRDSYKCVRPEKVISHLMDFKVPVIIKEAQNEYAFTSLSAVEIWSDYSYVQRGIEKSPYFIKVLKKDVPYWKEFFNKRNIPNYIGKGRTIGEYVILVPVDKITSAEKEGIKVEPLKETLSIAKDNSMFAYAYNYMRDKYAAG